MNGEALIGSGIEMRLVCISDTHSLHEQISPIPDGDVLIHAGDFSRSGKLFETQQFAEWMGSKQHKFKIAIAGNHDYCMAGRHPISTWAREAFQKGGVFYLQGDSTIIDGIKFYGFPWQPIFRNMAFNARPGELWGRLKLVPEDTDVLVSHGPPLGIFDYIPETREHVGSFEIAKTIERLPNLKAHIFGHIHESYGMATRESDGLKFANASICTERYKPTNKPIIIDI
jgi:Icc-related predicted phosphoesterase